jgi:cytochrome b561
MAEVNLNRYPFMWRILHWLSALVIVWAMSSGFYILFAQPEKQVIHTIANFNVSVTLLFVPIFLIRLIMSYIVEKPITPQLVESQQRLAHKVHRLMYFVVCTVLISGILMMERNMIIFSAFELTPFLSKGVITEGFFMLHRMANFLLVLLLAAHITAVIKHQLNGIPILRKMI